MSTVEVKLVHEHIYVTINKEVFAPPDSVQARRFLPVSQADAGMSALPDAPGSYGTVRLGKAPVEDPDDDLLLVDRTVAT
jgi:hypothetical protein